MNRETTILLVMLAVLTLIAIAVALLIGHSLTYTPPPDVDTTLKVVGSIQ